MKAIDYYNEFISSPIEKTTEEIINKFIHEVSEIIKKRNARTDSAVSAVIKEQNNKWNAMVALFDKHNKTCPFNRNAIWDYFSKHIPQLNDYK